MATKKTTEAPAKATAPKASRTLWVAIAATLSIAGLIGGVVWYGLVVQPEVEKAKLKETTIAACKVFDEYLAKATKETSEALVLNDIFRGANKGIEVFDPAGTSTKETFGPVYDEMLRLGQIEFGFEAIGNDIFETVTDQILLVQARCMEAAGTNTSAPTPSATS